ncbi:MAG: DUF2177 family protein [Rhizobacter sp.]
MTRTLVAYLATALVLVALDMLWLRVIAPDWYQQGIGHLMSGQINLVAGALFYLLFPVGLMIFAVMPNLANTWVNAALMGALFGCFAYGTYDLTSLAILKNWPVGLSVIDIAWGSFVSAAAASAGRLAAGALS